MFAKVIVDVSVSEVDRIFDYECDESVQRGHRVLVPFGSRQIEGYVVEVSQNASCAVEKIKKISTVLDENPVIIEEMLSLSPIMREKYNLNLVDALRLFIPAQMRGGRVKELKRTFARISDDYLHKPVEEYIKKSALAQFELIGYLKESDGDFTAQINKNYSASALRNLTERGIVVISEVKVKRAPYKRLKSDSDEDVILTDAQNEAVTAINNGRGTFLLHGVTGSGKTLVYINCIKNALNCGKTAIMLVPEISLTPQVFSVFKSAFGERIAILHSGLSAGERFDEWQRMLLGEADVVIGARSAVFAPLKNVGVIIIDEEHDASYISDNYPRYNTFDIARFRSDYNKCPLILGSATPSVESYYHAEKGEFTLLKMDKRINNVMPKISIINMCSEYLAGNQIFSYRLYTELKKTLDEGRQAMLFLNRRGYSSFIRCSSCGYVATCENCDVSLVYHKEEEVLKCHYCAGRYSVPTVCPVCKNESLRRGYVGTQQIVEKLAVDFPAARVLRMDNDTTQSKDAHFNILDRFKRREADILVGTQMIAKGHDFPLVTLVGILDADMSLHYADFRSAERTFQLITQMSGRAGRAEYAGNVILQTYTPHHYAYKFAVDNDYVGFYKKEINLREVTQFPPFSDILRILICGEDEQKTAAALKSVYERVLQLSKDKFKGCFAYLAYMRAPLKRIKRQNRMQIICRIRQSFDEIVKIVYNLIEEVKGVTVSAEINPKNLS